MADDAGDGLRLGRLPTCVTDVLRILRRQVTVVLRVQQMEQLRSLGLHHHVGGVWIARAHRVDDLMLGAERLRLVPTVKGQVASKSRRQ